MEDSAIGWTERRLTEIAPLLQLFHLSFLFLASSFSLKTQKAFIKSILSFFVCFLVFSFFFVECQTDFGSVISSDQGCLVVRLKSRPSRRIPHSDLVHQHSYVISSIRSDIGSELGKSMAGHHPVTQVHSSSSSATTPKVVFHPICLFKPAFLPIL
eukprot:TRINITY_DN9938_c0_g4_i2.p1 TRINITY_DN9938_c0_g4~~TRINITY_DN9938_c0_g4_i2.p1  ORF type:complete len:175 (+),score=5.77 TRINITY_DN9938_c0_g4_i2:59-526(+)